MWQRLDTLEDDEGASVRAERLKQELKDLKKRQDDRFDAMLAAVAPDVDSSAVGKSD